MCTWYEIRIEPRDVLFFRGARPISGASIGEGALWPMPSVFHQSLLSAFHERWPVPQTEWEHGHTKGADKNPDSTCRFGGLKTVGVFPEKDGTLFVPTPSDIQCLDDSEKVCVLSPGALKGEGDLPSPLKKGLFKPGEATKKKPGNWISLKDLESYLQGALDQVETLSADEIFSVESRPGIGMDPQTGTADTGGDDEGGKFYMAEYMRLSDGKNGKGRVSLTGLATCEQYRAKDDAPATDVLERFFDGNNQPSFVFGGQRAVAYLEGTRNSETARRLFARTDCPGQRIKWVTLTPSIFTGGWLPSWVDESGAVKEYTIPPRDKNEPRKAWRDRIKEEKSANETVLGTLVAACIPKPFAYSGWRAHGGGEKNKTGARPTRLCVPAGAVYYFDVPEGISPELLYAFLHGQRKSDMAAEKGFGFGVCGTWCKGDLQVA